MDHGYGHIDDFPQGPSFRPCSKCRKPVPLNTRGPLCSACAHPSGALRRPPDFTFETALRCDSGLHADHDVEVALDFDEDDMGRYMVVRSVRLLRHFQGRAHTREVTARLSPGTKTDLTFLAREEYERGRRQERAELRGGDR